MSIFSGGTVQKSLRMTPRGSSEIGCFVTVKARLLGTEELPVMALGATYSNIVLLGIPLIYALFGEPGLLPILMIVTLHSLVLLPLTMILIEIGRGTGADRKSVV